ncbi:MAG: hypothetical protein JW395_1212 [Nitrospira sp.]|nr:hypothetical protein [Nitrospira sp.]
MLQSRIEGFQGIQGLRKVRITVPRHQRRLTRLRVGRAMSGVIEIDRGIRLPDFDLQPVAQLMKVATRRVAIGHQLDMGLGNPGLLLQHLGHGLGILHGIGHLRDRLFPILADANDHRIGVRLVEWRRSGQSRRQ